MLILWRRDLTRLSRSAGTPWFLLVYLGLGLLAAQGTLKIMTDMPQMLSLAGLLEPVVLSVLVVVQLVLLLLAAGYVASDIGAHDLERGEQELLVAGGRTRFGLLVTKYAVTVTWVGLLWLAYLPIYTLLPRLGSFSLHLLAKLAVVQLAPVAAAAALGLFVAQITRSRRAATTVVTGAVLLALLGSYLLSGLLTYAVQGGNSGMFFGGGGMMMNGGKGGPMLMRGPGIPAQPAGLGIAVSDGVMPTFTRRMLLLATLSPANGVLAVLDAPGQPPLMPGLPVYFTAPYLTVVTRHPLWEVQAAAYGVLALLLLVLAYVVTAWPKRRFWRRRHRARLAPPQILPARPALTGRESS